MKNCEKIVMSDVNESQQLTNVVAIKTAANRKNDKTDDTSKCMMIVNRASAELCKTVKNVTQMTAKKTLATMETMRTIKMLKNSHRKERNSRESMRWKKLENCKQSNNQLPDDNEMLVASNLLDDKKSPANKKTLNDKVKVKVNVFSCNYNNNNSSKGDDMDNKKKCKMTLGSNKIIRDFIPKTRTWQILPLTLLLMIFVQLTIAEQQQQQQHQEQKHSSITTSALQTNTIAMHTNASAFDVNVNVNKNNNNNNKNSYSVSVSNNNNNSNRSSSHSTSNNNESKSRSGRHLPINSHQHSSSTARHSRKYSQPLSLVYDGDSGISSGGSLDPIAVVGGSTASFHPIIPKGISMEYISRNVFTPNGQYRVFQPDESDLRATVSMGRANENGNENENLNESKLKTAEQRETDNQIAIEGEGKRSDEQTTAKKNLSPNETPIKATITTTTTPTTASTTTKNKIQLTAVNMINADEQATDGSKEMPVDSDSLKSWHAERPIGSRVNVASEVAGKVFDVTDEDKQRKAALKYYHSDVDKAKSARELPANDGNSPVDSDFNAAPREASTNTTTQKNLEELLTQYVENFFNNAQYEPLPELVMALQQNFSDAGKQTNAESSGFPVKFAVGTDESHQNSNKHVSSQHNAQHREEQHQRHQHHGRRPPRHTHGHFKALLQKHLNLTYAAERNATERSIEFDGESINVSIPRALQSGRLLFFTGLKKIMWPIYMGLQILKSLFFALLIPTLIGSFGKLVGKGITSGSAPLFIRPMDEPQDLDFKDNNFNFDDEKFALDDDNGMKGAANPGYSYNQAEASQNQNQYAYNPSALNQNLGLNERQHLMQDSYLSALSSLSSASFKNSNGISSGLSGGLSAPGRQKPASPANMNTFQTFQKVPSSSLLLSNYDPFYSPLLSRLDSVFAQLKLNSDDENCREKAICLMYANPAKYAPYSNLVSAQLSRELNELRKPTSDNPDILRFFKYMRAAKDGQDGVDCEKTFEKCTEFKDFENPAMVSTYHDINKLVQARKL